MTMSDNILMFISAGGSLIVLLAVFFIVMKMLSYERSANYKTQSMAGVFRDIRMPVCHECGLTYEDRKECVNTDCAWNQET